MSRPRRGRPQEDYRSIISEGSGWPTWIDPSAIDQLQDAIQSGQIGHAYLLSGPKGTGKAALATALAQALCCQDSDSTAGGLPCGRCRACRNVARGVHPDVETYSLASQALLSSKPLRGSNLSIDTVRRLRASAALLPLECKRRVLIVEDAETLLEPAQQALLKTLEEPPSTVTILLLADEPEALLETVRSRCREIVLRPIAAPAVANVLCKRGVDDSLANEIAKFSRGCGAWALTAAADATILQARRAEWDTATKWVTATRYERLVTAFKLGEQFGKRRGEVIGIVQAAIGVLREEMIRAAGWDTSPNGVVASCFGSPTPALAVTNALSASLQCLRDLETNVRPKLALEAMVLAWPNSEPRPS